MTETQAVCLYCQKNSQQVPLIAVEFQGKQFNICPQHLPILIHKPTQLVGKLPGAENLEASGHSHD